ncbi:hypothetical protein QQ045_008837 [Rhodiola kirilowii]
MSDWGPVFVAVLLFILLTPGLLIQLPGQSRIIEFGNLKTSGAIPSSFTPFSISLSWNSIRCFSRSRTQGRKQHKFETCRAIDPNDLRRFVTNTNRKKVDVGRERIGKGREIERRREE